MHINFILPGLSEHQVIGGFRVHYEYANGLARLGHQVTVTHTLFNPEPLTASLLSSKLNGDIRHLIHWFTFEPSIRVTFTINNRFLKPCDILICSAWQTSEIFGDNHQTAWLTAQIAYDYEFWAPANQILKERISAAFRKTDIMISTSSIVSQMLGLCQREIDAVICCGYQNKIFKLTRPYHDRPLKIGILLRDHETKRTVDAIKALEMVRSVHEIEVLAAGKWSKPLPNWVTPYDASSDEKLNDFYNLISIFLLPSEFEGWGLPAMEAMAAGAVVISARNGGVEHFLVDGINGLLYQPKNIEQLHGAICRLASDRALRVSCASNALETVKHFEWGNAISQLETLLVRKMNELG